MWLVCCTFSNLSNPGYVHDARSIQCSVNGRNTRGIRRITFTDRSRCKLCFQYHRQTNSTSWTPSEYLISIFHSYPISHIHERFQNSKLHPNLTFDLLIFLSNVVPKESLWDVGWGGIDQVQSFGTQNLVFPKAYDMEQIIHTGKCGPNLKNWKFLLLILRRMRDTAGFVIDDERFPFNKYNFSARLQKYPQPTVLLKCTLITVASSGKLSVSSELQNQVLQTHFHMDLFPRFPYIYRFTVSVATDQTWTMWLSNRYTYTTREAFRFHFKEPPAAPLTHEETVRTRRLMDWERGQQQASLDTKPKMVSLL